jgi:hypothetical protein
MRPMGLAEAKFLPIAIPEAIQTSYRITHVLKRRRECEREGCTQRES